MKQREYFVYKKIKKLKLFTTLFTKYSYLTSVATTSVLGSTTSMRLLVLLLCALESNIL